MRGIMPQKISGEARIDFPGEIVFDPGLRIGRHRRHICAFDFADNLLRPLQHAGLFLEFAGHIQSGVGKEFTGTHMLQSEIIHQEIPLILLLLNAVDALVGLVQTDPPDDKVGQPLQAHADHDIGS